MRILIVSETLVAGGAETFALRLHEKLRELKHDCDLLCLNADRIDSRLLAEGKPEPLVVPIAGLRWIRRFDGALKRFGIPFSWQRSRTAFVLSKRLASYDVIHTNLIGADLLFAELKRTNPHLRIVSTLHGDYALHELRVGSLAEQRSSKTWARDRVLLAAMINSWVYIAEQQKRLMVDRLGIAPARLTHIHNGYQPSTAALAAMRERRLGQPFIIAMAARGSIPEKGWSVLIDAFRRLKGDARLWLIGEGEHLSELKQIHGSDPRIHFLGFSPDPASLVALADVFVLPTTYPAESLPTVVIEALSVSVPVVASEIGDLRSMLTTPSGVVAGTILPLVDGRVLVDELASAIQAYDDDPAKLAKARQMAAEAFLKFDMTRCAQAYVRLYEGVVEAH